VPADRSFNEYVTIRGTGDHHAAREVAQQTGFQHGESGSSISGRRDPATVDVDFIDNGFGMTNGCLLPLQLRDA